MDSTAREIHNCAAAQWALIVADEPPMADADHDAMIRNLAAYGPAVNERD